MKSLVNTKKQKQFKKFIAKDASFLKKIVGGEGTSGDEPQGEDTKIKL